MVLHIPDPLFHYFSSTPLGPLFQVPELVRDAEHELHRYFRRFLDELPSELVDAARKDPMLELYGGTDDHARQLAAIKLFHREIPRRRLNALRANDERPSPYNLPELSDLAVDSEGLVPLSRFSIHGDVLERNGRAFMMAPSTPSPNSSYWFLLQIVNNKLTDRTLFRLDPFMHGRSDDFPRMAYMMWLYGRPLDWSRLEGLREAEHGRWSPSRATRSYEYTDFVWDPRRDGVHFQCEEVPTHEAHECCGSRYLHAIYDPRSQEVTHLDGALRIYDQNQLDLRRQIHVRNSGKAGVRTKLFRISEAIPRGMLADLAATYFVWNDDIAEYFAAGQKASPNVRP